MITAVSASIFAMLNAFFILVILLCICEPPLSGGCFCICFLQLYFCICSAVDATGCRIQDRCGIWL